MLRRFWAAVGWQRGGSSRARVLEGGWAWARPYSRVPELAAPPKEFSICRVGRLGGRETLTRLCGALQVDQRSTLCSLKPLVAP